MDNNQSATQLTVQRVTLFIIGILCNVNEVTFFATTLRKQIMPWKKAASTLQET
jgi:hypothetical protein